MKKRRIFLIVFAFLLSTVPHVFANSSDVSQSYGTVVHSLINQYGTCEDTASFAPEDTSLPIGLLGGAILDLDHDGYQEMIVLYGDSQDSYDNQMSNQSFVFCDVWDAVGGVVTKILHIPISIYTDTYSISLSNIDGTYYLYTVDYMHPLDEAYGTTITIYSFDKNNAMEILSLSDDYIMGENKKMCLKDEQWSELDNDTFTRLRSEYVHPSEDTLLFSIKEDKSILLGDGTHSQKETLDQFLWEIAHPYIRVELNGENLDFPNAPLIQDGRTLVPMRVIFEAMGAQVDWQEESRTIVATKDDTTITMQIDNLEMNKNGETITLDVAPQIFYDSTFVPVRAIAESFGCQVRWDDAQKTVRIYNN